MLTVQTLVVGDLSANCYLVSSEVSPGTVARRRNVLNPAEGDSSQVKPVNECLIIDPGDDADYITQTILDQKLKPTAIILTHGHFDHVLGCLELKLNFPARNASHSDAGGNIPILLHQSDLKLYSSANQSAKHWLKKQTLKVPPIDIFLKEGDQITVGKEKLTVIETPGHTPGSICLYRGPTSIQRSDLSTSILFTGDTLFADGVGRTDFSYSSPADLQKSLRKISNLQYQISQPKADPPLAENIKSQIVIYPGHGPTALLSEALISF